MAAVRTGARGQRVDQRNAAECRAPPDALPPRLLQRAHALLERARVATARLQAVAKSAIQRLTPSSACGGPGAVIAGRGQAADIVPRERGQDQRDGREEPIGEPAASQDEVDQGATGPAVAVGERVDRLELRVRDGRLRDGGQRVVVGEKAQRSCRNSGTRSGGGGTKAAEHGLKALPPIQFCSVADRRRPPAPARSPPAAAVDLAAGPPPASGCRVHRVSVAQSIASMFPRTSSAVTSPRVLTDAGGNSALSSRRPPTSRPSMRDEATDSARSRSRASASVSTSASAELVQPDRAPPRRRRRPPRRRRPARTVAPQRDPGRRFRSRRGAGRGG